MGAENNLQNTNIPEINYSKSKQNTDNLPIDPTSNNYVNQYLNTKSNTQNSNTQNSNKIDSLSGNKLDISDFKHNNMVPFFGSKIKGQLYDSNLNESILDNTQGAGNQYIKKVEHAPLFKPEDTVQNSNGNPNNNEFYQSRVIPGSKISNVLPWTQEMVGPGLGLGATTNGSGGFNSGMLNREGWMEQTVDELRVKTNPKITYGLQGHEGPASSKIQNLGQPGAIEKNRQNTDYALGPDRWFTTTGSYTAATAQSEEVLRDGNRQTTTKQYFGIGGNDGDSKASYYKGEYEQSSKQSLGQTDINPAAAMGKGFTTESDFGMKGYNVLPNNRQENFSANNYGNVGNVGGFSGVNGTFKAVLAPIMDILRPSRKENLVGNNNLVGNVTSFVPNLPITNPNDKVKTTIKEMTSDKIGLNYLNVSHIDVPGGGYKSTEVQATNPKRNKIDSSTIGFVGGSNHEGFLNTTAWDNQNNNTIKTQEIWSMPGGTSMFNSHDNIEIARQDSDRSNKRMPNQNLVIPQAPYQGGDGIPSLETYGKINMPQQYSQELNNDRMNPDILSAFKNNPYTKSLNSY
jgi:hypothetical protein